MSGLSSNPLLSEWDVAVLLDAVHDAASLCQLPAFAEHSRETFELFLPSTRRSAREERWPTCWRPSARLS